MLIGLEVRTRRGTQLNLPLGDTSSGLFVEDIQGLDPVKATLVSSSFAQQDGEQYHSSRREARNIKIQLGLRPDFVTINVQDLRTRAYNFFMPKSEVSLRFRQHDGTYVDISGRVESAETTLFSAEPTIVVSIMCFNPDFIDPTPKFIDGNTSNLTSGYEEKLIDYTGTVETGIVLTVWANRSLQQFTVYHRTPSDEIRSLDFVTPMVNGDTITIATSSGAKSATIRWSTAERSALYGVSPHANWIALEEGDNFLRVYSTGAPMPYRIEYTTKYGGL